MFLLNASIFIWPNSLSSFSFTLLFCKVEVAFSAVDEVVRGHAKKAKKNDDVLIPTNERKKKAVFHTSCRDR
jgi:hypothetical protein